jgi:hypothetical protein
MIKTNQRISFLFLVLVLLCANRFSYAQNNRISTYENVGWYSLQANVKLHKDWGINTEYHCRRSNVITNWQQSLLRFGVNYHINPRVQLRAGYAWVETFPYGSIPINSYGKVFTEHRFFETLQLQHQEGSIELSHRFMLEQRFVGKYTSANSMHENEYPLLHRARYMFRLQFPLKGKELKDHTPYATLYDEIFIGFGNHVNANVFDQNRFGALLGYRFNPQLRLEAGYINQVLQFGRLVGGKNVYQYNSGPIVNLLVNLDYSKAD